MYLSGIDYCSGIATAFIAKLTHNSTTNSELWFDWAFRLEYASDSYWIIDNPEEPGTLIVTGSTVDLANECFIAKIDPVSKTTVWGRVFHAFSCNAASAKIHYKGNGTFVYIMRVVTIPQIFTFNVRDPGFLLCDSNRTFTGYPLVDILSDGNYEFSYDFPGSFSVTTGADTYTDIAPSVSVIDETFEDPQEFYCSNHGSCEGESSPCDCDPNYYGVDCEVTTCFGIFSNTTEMCSGQGNCTKHDFFTCFDGYYRKNCSSWKCYGVLSDSELACSGNGECLITGLCDCDDDYYGDNCYKYDKDFVPNRKNVWRRSAMSEGPSEQSYVQLVVGDDGYFVGGLMNQGSGDGLSITKLGFEGEFEWSKFHYSLSAKDIQADKCKKIRDGDILCCGDYNEDPFLMKISAVDGTVQWAYRFELGGISGIQQCFNLVESSVDDSIYTISRTMGGNKMSFLTKHFADGTVQWKKVFGAVCTLSTILARKNGGVVVGGTERVSGLDWNFLLFGILPNGTANQTIVFGMGKASAELYSMIFVHDETSIVVGGQYEANPSAVAQPFIVKVLMTGDDPKILWAGNLDIDTSTENGFFNSIVESEDDGNLVIMGDECCESFQFIIKICSETGNLIWSRHTNARYGFDGQVAMKGDGIFVQGAFYDAAMGRRAPGLVGWGIETFSLRKANHLFCEWEHGDGLTLVPVDVSTITFSSNLVFLNITDRPSNETDILADLDEEVHDEDSAGGDFDRDCSGHGNCDSSHNCVCELGHSGFSCEKNWCGGILYSEDEVVCEGRGNCTRDTTEEICECPANTGEFCEDLACFGILKTNVTFVCSGNGECSNDHSCECYPGYFGYRCEIVETECFGVDKDDFTTVCSGNGICQGNDTCLCNTGFGGVDCSIKMNYISEYFVLFGNDSATNYVRGMVQDKFGFLYVVGYNDAYAEHQRVVISKHYPNNGSIVWIKSVDASSGRYQSQRIILRDNDENLVIALYDQNSDGFVAKYSTENCSKVYSKRFNSPDQLYMTLITATQGGNFAVMGHTNDRDVVSVTSGLWSIYFSKLDSNGSVNFQVFFGVFGGSILGRRVIETIDNDFVISGYVEDTDISFGNGMDLLVMKISGSSGRVIWARTIGRPEECEFEGEDITETRGGDYVVAGRTSCIRFGINDIYVAKISYFGDLLWAKGIGLDPVVSESANISAIRNGVITDPNDNVIILGFISTGTRIGSDIFFAKLDHSDGSIISNSFQGENNRTGIVTYTGISVYMDRFESSYYVVGNTNNRYPGTNKYHSVLAKFNIDGNSCLQKNVSGEEGQVLKLTSYSSSWVTRRLKDGEILAIFNPLVIDDTTSSSELETVDRMISSSWERLCYSFSCDGVDHRKDSVCNGNGNCVDWDECICEAGWRGLFCNCSGGYYGDFCEIIDCFGILSNETSSCSGVLQGECVAPDDCKCKENYEGEKCEIYFGKCGDYSAIETGFVCSGKGVCTPSGCNCSSGYLGTICDFWTCNHLGKDYSGVCGSHGFCVSTDDCECWDGYAGRWCDKFYCGSFLNNETSSVCSGHGTCESSQSCNCAMNYTGSQCEVELCHGISKGSEYVCSGHGSCSSGVCTCELGYRNEKCDEFYCSTSCHGHGLCVAGEFCSCNDSVLTGHYQPPDCKGCKSGYSGVDCKDNLCVDPFTFCNGHGVCDQVTMTGCICNGTFDSSTFCSSCIAGYFDTSKNCSVKCEKNLNCSGHGDCGSVTGGCECYENFGSGFWNGDLECSSCTENYYGTGCQNYIKYQNVTFSASLTEIHGLKIRLGGSSGVSELDCATIFSNATMNLLGDTTNLQCLFPQTDETMIVSFSPQTSKLVAGKSTLGLEFDDSLFPSLNSLEFTSSPISVPLGTTNPKIKINGLQGTALTSEIFEVTSCSSLVLDSSTSQGSGVLLRKWSSDNSKLQTLLSEYDDSESISIPSNLISDSVSKVYLNLSSPILQQSDFVPIQLKTVSDSIVKPVITIEGPSKVKMNTPIVLEARLDVNFSCLEDATGFYNSLSYTWKNRYSGSYEPFDFSKYDVEVSNRVLYLPPYLVKDGSTYSFYLETRIKSTSKDYVIPSVSDFTFIVEVSPLQCTVLGGERRVIVKEKGVKIIGSFLDPDDLNLVSQCWWECKDEKTKGICDFGANSGFEVPGETDFSGLELKTETIKDWAVGQEYRISLFCVKGTRSCGDEVVIELESSIVKRNVFLVTNIVNDPESNRKILNPKDQVLFTSQMELIGNETYSSFAYDWSIRIGSSSGMQKIVHGVDLLKYVFTKKSGTNSSSRSLGFSNLGDLVPAQTSFSVGLVISQKGGAEIGRANTREFEMNSPPNYGYCFVHPSDNGYAMKTDFSVRCNNWFDTESPLTYSFYYYHPSFEKKQEMKTNPISKLLKEAEEDWVPLKLSSFSSSEQFVIPVVKNGSVFVISRITDSLGSYTDFYSNEIRIYPSFTSSSLQSASANSTELEEDITSTFQKWMTQSRDSILEMLRALLNLVEIIIELKQELKALASLYPNSVSFVFQKMEVFIEILQLQIIEKLEQIEALMNKFAESEETIHLKLRISYFSIFFSTSSSSTNTTSSNYNATLSNLKLKNILESLVRNSSSLFISNTKNTKYALGIISKFISSSDRFFSGEDNNNVTSSSSHEEEILGILDLADLIVENFVSNNLVSGTTDPVTILDDDTNMRTILWKDDKEFFEDSDFQFNLTQDSIGISFSSLFFTEEDESGEDNQISIILNLFPSNPCASISQNFSSFLDTELPQIIRIDFFSTNLNSNELKKLKQNEKSEKEEKTFQFDIPGDFSNWEEKNKKPVCSWYDSKTSSFVSRGCRHVKTYKNKKKIRCECNHTTDYAAMFEGYVTEMNWLTAEDFENIVKLNMDNVTTLVVSVAIMSLYLLVMVMIEIIQCCERICGCSLSSIYCSFGCIYHLFKRIGSKRHSKIHDVNYNEEPKKTQKKKKKKKMRIRKVLFGLLEEHKYLGLFCSSDPQVSIGARCTMFTIGFFAMMLCNALTFGTDPRDAMQFVVTMFMSNLIPLPLLFIINCIFMKSTSYVIPRKKTKEVLEEEEEEERELAEDVFWIDRSLFLIRQEDEEEDKKEEEEDESDYQKLEEEDVEEEGFEGEEDSDIVKQEENVEIKNIEDEELNEVVEEGSTESSTLSSDEEDKSSKSTEEEEITESENEGGTELEVIQQTTEEDDKNSVHIIHSSSSTSSEEKEKEEEDPKTYHELTVLSDPNSEGDSSPRNKDEPETKRFIKIRRKRPQETPKSKFIRCLFCFCLCMDEFFDFLEETVDTVTGLVKKFTRKFWWSGIFFVLLLFVLYTLIVGIIAYFVYNEMSWFGSRGVIFYSVIAFMFFVVIIVAMYITSKSKSHQRNLRKDKKKGWWNWYGNPVCCCLNFCCSTICCQLSCFLFLLFLGLVVGLWGNDYAEDFVEVGLGILIFLAFWVIVMCVWLCFHLIPPKKKKFRDDKKEKKEKVGILQFCCCKLPKGMTKCVIRIRFPWFFKYFNYVLCWVCMLVMVYLLVLYGIKFDQEQEGVSDKWLFSNGMSTVEDMLIQEPIGIFLKSVILAIIVYFFEVVFVG